MSSTRNKESEWNLFSRGALENSSVQSDTTRRFDDAEVCRLKTFLVNKILAFT